MGSVEVWIRAGGWRRMGKRRMGRRDRELSLHELVVRPLKVPGRAGSRRLGRPTRPI